MNLLESIEIETAPNPTHAVLWLHGLGADGNDFAPLVPELQWPGAPAMRFIFPHAPVQPITINNGYAMRAWYDIYALDLVRREDETGVQASREAIDALLKREIERGIPAHHIVLGGFSQGCAMSLYTGLRFPAALAGVVGLSGYLPRAAALAAEAHEANRRTPIFQAHGLQDPVVALERGEATRRTLEDLGYDVTWKTYPMPHSVCPDEIADIRTFLAGVLSRS